MCPGFWSREKLRIHIQPWTRKACPGYTLGMITEPQNDVVIPWKQYAVTVTEVWVAFSLATFSLLMYMSNLNSDTSTIIFAVVLGLLYAFVVIACIHRLVTRLSVGALMLMVPIAPLAVLLLVVALLPVIQNLQ